MNISKITRLSLVIVLVAFSAHDTTFGATSFPGIVAWWTLQGNGVDDSGLNHALSIEGHPLFGDGEVGRSLFLDGADDYARVGAHPDIDLGARDGMTIELWIDPADTSLQQPLIEWTDNISVVGLHLWISVVSPWAGGGPRSLFANVIDTAGVAHHVSSAPNVIDSNAFTHVAFTYSKISGFAKLYANGQVVAQTNIGSITPETRTPVYVGWRPLGGGQYRFAGKLDEITLYSRELSQEELASIFQAGAAGKPPLTNPPPPVAHANFDLSRDFSLTNNPAEVWSYGVKSDFAGPLELLVAVRTFTADNGVPIRAWERATYNLPVVAKVLGTNTAISDGGRFTAQGGTVYFAPGADGAPQNFGIIRFTAPSNGNYGVQAVVQQLFDGTRSRDSDFHVLKDGAELFGAFLEPNTGTNFADVVALGTGSTLEFAVGRGADGLTSDSGLKIAAVITPTTNAPDGGTNSVPTHGLVSFWRGNGNALDSVGTNHGILDGEAGFRSGVSGSAFSIPAGSSSVRVPASPTLNVGVGPGFTIQLWVNPADASQRSPLVEWNDGTTFGAHLHLDPNQHGPGMQPPSSHTGGPGAIYAAMNLFGQWHQIVSDAGLVASNAWSQVAWTYDRSSGVSRLFCNGVVVSEQTFGDVTAETAYDLYLGRRPGAPGGDDVYSFNGGLDEVALYNYALSASEVLSNFQSVVVSTNPPAPPLHDDFNLSRDFRVSGNPNGVWSYGYVPAIGGPFTLMSTPRTNEAPSIPIWSWSVGGYSSPDVHWNASSSNIFYSGGGTFPPHSLWVTPGHESSTNAFAVMRFIVPSNGNYRVNASARNYLDVASADSDYHVVKNGAELFGIFLPAGVQSTGYSNVLSLASDDTLDFVVGRGQDGLLYASGLKLEAIITPTTNSETAILASSVMTEQGFGFSIATQGGGACVIETSEDLVHWNYWTNLTCTNLILPIWDHSRLPKRFYRARPLYP